MANTSQRITFTGALGHELAARMHLPEGELLATALFAHCFTCSKDIQAAVRISGALAELGIATMRFDFTGIGESEGDFAGTSFSSNIGDVLAAVNFLRAEYQPPSLLIGHSLGGAAVLAAAGEVDEVKLVATVGAPSNTTNLKKTLRYDPAEIAAKGYAEVNLGGRPFKITAEFVDDLENHRVEKRIAGINAALMVFHAPGDTIVNIDHARRIFEHGRHPKSFISLDQADHLLTNRPDAVLVADMISAWARRHLDG